MSSDLIREVERAIKNGDPDTVRDLLLPLNEKERRAAAKQFGEPWGRTNWVFGKPLDRQDLAATVAWAATATARQLSSWWFVLQRGSDLGVDPRIADVILSRGRGFVDNLVRMVLDAGGAVLWPLVRRAVKERVIERPEGEAYLRSMIFGVGGGADASDNVGSVYEGLLEDPELLDEAWRLFEHDLGGDLANSATWSYADGRYSRGENRWLYALTRLAAEGRLDRRRLLDASLDALMRDFRPSGLSWYGDLHEALEPSLQEREARLDRYLALVTSPAAPALKAGLTGLKELGEAVSSDQLSRAAAAALVQPLKTHAIAMLRLLEAAAKGDAAGRPGVLAAAAQALAHPKPDVQERALKLLERYPDDVPREELLSYLDAVAPTLRARLEHLTGLEMRREIVAPPVEELTGGAALAVEDGRWPEPRMPNPGPAGDPLSPVGSVDELIELAASLLEGQGTGDDAERFLDGVSRLCAERPRRFKERTEGLVKQAQAPWNPFPTADSGLEIVSLVVVAWTRERKPVGTARHMLGGLLEARAIEVAHRAAQRNARPLLSFPTHSGGWLDRDGFAERQRAARGVGNRPEAADYTAAYYRTLSGDPIRLVPERTLGTLFGYASYRVGVRIDALPEELAGNSILVWSLQQLGRFELWNQEDPLWPVGDALGARWLCTVLPGYPEIQYARALTAIVDFIETNPSRHPEVVLQWMVDPGLPLRDPAWMAVAAALLAKSPDLQRAATDVVVATVSDGRFDPERLGQGISWLLANGLGSLVRIERPLRDVGRVSPLHAAQIVRALEAFVAGAAPEQQHLHVPLGLALELAAGAGTAFESEPARLAAARIASSASRSSKVGKAAVALLGLERDAAAHGAILRLAAASAA